MEVKPGYKRTEIGVIPADWDVKPLGRLADVSAGGTPSRRIPAYWDGSIPWVTTAQINFGHISSTEEHISPFGLKNSAAKLLHPGTILLALYGQGKTRGKVAILDIEAASNQACAAIQITAKVSHSFIFHNLSSRYEFIRGLSNTGNQENLNGQIVRSIPVSIPPTWEEQEAIAGALSDADALIESLERLIAKKRQIKQGAMQELLTGQRRLPGFNGEWKSMRLGDLARIQRGASPRPIESPIWFDENSSIGWVRISDVTKSGMFLRETAQRLSPLGVQHSRPVLSGKLIMSICATVGRPVITEIDVCIHDGFVVFDNLTADRFFTYYALKWIEPNWTKHGQTGSQMNLNTQLINSTRIHVPPHSEQIAISETLTEIDSEIMALESKLAKARQLKQAMMQELLTGRIRLV